ncbi:restriction endonuclease subunit S [Oscillospiraceae bacterium 44-34]
MIQLGDICTKASSGIAQKDLEHCNGAYPIYGASGLIKYVDFYQQENPYVAVVKDGAGVGRVMQLPAKSSVIGTMQYIIPNEGISVQYLAYAMEHMNLAKYYTGATIPHIYFKDYCTEKLQKHSESEQYRIAAVLGKLTALISLRKQQLAKLDELVKAQFVEMFGKSVYPHYDLIDLIVEGSGLSYGIVQPGDDGTGEMGVLRPVDLIDGGISEKSIKFIDRKIGDAFKKTELIGNELLITVRGTTGITALTDKRFVGMNVTRGIAVIRFDEMKINPIYLNEYFKTDESQNYIQEHTRGATLQQINLSDLRVHKILVPPMKLQQLFSQFCLAVEQSKLTIRQSLDKLEVLRKSLMQEYFG